ncbi:hypothetical protein B9Z55_002222 [Caenorhabditis nigoni]|uniref:Uncharacterized protein n=1 Tax=Caenorhabditis nigoni TaxID=1611254 RepID=A0A2G5VJG8_9PELO|nr:hypothetical protein B9Z55_002222 [Caenorhabditis nigoni]
MVCGDCEKKLGKIVGVDPYRNKKVNRNADGTGPKTMTTKNRLIGVQKKATIVGAKCKLCKMLIHQVSNFFHQMLAASVQIGFFPIIFILKFKNLVEN